MQSILGCVDFSELEAPVIRAATTLASALRVELHVLHVGDPEPDFVGYRAGPETVRDAVAAKLRDQHRRVEEIAAEARLRGITAHPHLVRGAYAVTILREAERLGVGMIVLGSHGHGRLYTLLVGSVAQGVLRDAKVPVLVVPRAT